MSEALEIIASGPIESDEQLLAMLERNERLVVPNEDDLDLTHWWVIRVEGSETLYVGTPETFDLYPAEQNGRVQ